MDAQHRVSTVFSPRHGGRWQARCKTCPWRGPWRGRTPPPDASYAQAWTDRGVHMVAPDEPDWSIVEAWLEAR